MSLNGTFTAHISHTSYTCLLVISSVLHAQKLSFVHISIWWQEVLFRCFQFVISFLNDENTSFCHCFCMHAATHLYMHYNTQKHVFMCHWWPQSTYHHWFLFWFNLKNFDFSPFFTPSSMHTFVVCMSTLVNTYSFSMKTSYLTSLHLDNFIDVSLVSWMFVVMYFVFFSTRKAIQSFLLSV